MLRFLQFRQGGVRLHNAANMLCGTTPSDPRLASQRPEAARQGTQTGIPGFLPARRASPGWAWSKWPMTVNTWVRCSSASSMPNLPRRPPCPTKRPRSATTDTRTGSIEAAESLIAAMVVRDPHRCAIVRRGQCGIEPDRQGFVGDQTLVRLNDGSVAITFMSAASAHARSTATTVSSAPYGYWTLAPATRQHRRPRGDHGGRPARLAVRRMV